MTKLRCFQHAVFLIILLLSQDLLAFPANVLYWATTNYPGQFFTYDTAKPYTGAVDAINYACQQNPGIGTYSGTVRVDLPLPAAVSGYCQNTRIFFPGPFDGNLYTAYLYCNGVQRTDSMDDSPCQMLIDNKSNLGPFCPPGQCCNN